MNGAGKGSDYRRVDKKKFDKNYENIFGKKEAAEFQKEKIKKEGSEQV